MYDMLTLTRSRLSRVSLFRSPRSANLAIPAHPLLRYGRAMTAAGGFWSYVHADDEADAGRVAQLARDVVAQFEMLTGEPIELFLDRDALAWGDH